MKAIDSDDLSRKATDPTASLTALNFVYSEITSFHGNNPALDDSSSQLSFRPVVPFEVFGVKNILRTTLPYQLGGRGDRGLGDVSIFDLAVVTEEWGRWGIGPVMTFATDPSAPAEFAIGPAIGGVYQASKELSFGLFNQNVFGDDTAISQLQPIAVRQLGDGWALSLGDLQFAYDWERSQWLSIPIGLQIGRVMPVGGQPMRFSFNPQYNLRDADGLPEWQFLATVSILAPTG